MAFDLPAKDKAEAQKNAKAKAKYIAANPILVEQAYQYGWANNFTSCDKTRAGWYKYNTWLSADGTDISMWEGSTFGYMLGQLKVAYSFNPPKRPVGKKVDVVVTAEEAALEAEYNATMAKLQGVEPVSLEDNIALINKMATYFVCDVFVDPTEVVVQGASDEDGNSYVYLFSKDMLSVMNTTQVRAMIKKAVGNLNLALRVATPIVVAPVAVVEATVVYPTVFKTKDNDLLGVGSYVLHNKLHYMVYGFTKTGKAKLVGLMTDESLKIKAAGVEAAELVVKANFPMVDGLMIVKPTLAIDSKGKFVQPTDEQLKAAYLICNS
jgi:hypothetical protein